MKMTPTSSMSGRGYLIIGSILMGVVSLTLNLPSVDMTFDESSSSKEQTNNNLLRKSIVFDLKTPKVFYCPQEKPADTDKMIVKARPLDKLCQFQGQPRPKGSPSDCYNDVDETDFACDEKRRFMIRLDLASEMGDLTNGDYGFDSDPDYILSKGPSGNKKKLTPNGKKF